MARPARRPGNLPAEATSFVGRRRELAEVNRRLAESRLVCLTGPGGVGKTRLAIRAAAGLARGFPDGAWLVELAEIRDPALVGNAVMAALDLRDQAVPEPVALLVPYLRDKRLLLVVDNCEHLLAAAGGLVAQVLRAAPGVRVIATSREPLSISGEHLVPVPPLELREEAMTLFAERAAAASGGFELTAANRAAVADLCRRLDGLPLAIELAAVRTRVLTPRQIVDRLADRFGLLTVGGRAALRTTIDWSHDLLGAGEQAMLRRLCVFGGRFTLEDVEAVCADGPALDVLSSLVDKSLVLKEDVRDVATYRLHETMREYAGLKLRAAGEAQAVELRCAEYYRARCRQSAGAARYQMMEWLEWMDLEIDNVRAVLQRCDGRLGLGLASSIGWYWVIRATSEGVRWLDELLGSGHGHPLAYFLRGFLAVLQSDHVAARPVLERAVAAARDGGHTGLESMSLSMASIAHHMSGDRESGARLLDAAQAVTAGLDDYPAKIMLLQARALNGLIEGDLDAAGSAASDGVRLSREVGDLYSLGMMLFNLGSVALARCDLDGSKPLLTEALGVARGIDDRVAQYGLLNALGCQAAHSGQARLAARLLGAAETVQASVGAGVLPHLGVPVHKAKEAARAALGAPAFDTEWDTGARLSRQAAIELALGITPRALERLPGSPLTKRESQVAQLVAEGLSNRQIAARLLISEHTVDSHIRGIMNKLGFGARAQIAAWTASAEFMRRAVDSGGSRSS